MKQIGVGNSHAKIILIGEHSVVYGQPAIALPISNIKLTATLTKSSSNGQTIDSIYYRGPIQNLPNEMNGIRLLLRQLITYFNGETDQWQLVIKSMLPAERGMGSSAASAIAIIRAFFDYYQRSLSKTQLLSFANVEEKLTHTNPSGLDAATTSSSEPIWFTRGEIGHSIAMNLSATLVIADTGILGQTATAVTRVADQAAEFPADTQKKIEQLGTLTKNAATALKDNDALALGHIMDEAQTQLSSLSVSHPQLEHLIKIARANGALGAKLTGGGIGGCMIALVNNESVAQQLSQQLLGAGATQTWIEPLGGKVDE